MLWMGLEVAVAVERVSFLRVWAMSDETPGSATKRSIYAQGCKNLPDALTCFRT